RYKGNNMENTISVMVSNVLQTNHEVDKLLALVKKMQPDVLLTLETNKWWEEKLKPLEANWPHTIKQPLENLYGMNFYSRLELKDVKINYLVTDEIPSFQAKVQLKSGVNVQLFCVHPKPPFPTESKTSLFRDAELLLVGKKVEDIDSPVLVFGDFNDVAWSRTTRLFQKVSELLDPRIGRGFFNTFHAEYPFMRFPLDHIFHSSHFKLVKMKRLSYVGSDHFPIYTRLHLNSSFQNQQEEPDADNDEEGYASEVINDANPIKRNVKQ
ncbi:MAG TPA: endonuclease/exonuclease/phosphatase family protein, partial [Prolixibacteraceae bacterium]|nr:endonuclease/exonuclease/phosphatase family protein [Prolixibacteraceae bacterium]